MNKLKKLTIIGPEILDYSYGQVMAFDSSEPLPGSHWTQHHYNQGFVRREFSVAVRTLTEYGSATVSAYLGEPMSLDSYARAISVPIEIPSGILHLEGPDEYPIKRSVTLNPGCYFLLICQACISDDELSMDIYITKSDDHPLNSKVLKADIDLCNIDNLCETGTSA